MRILRPEPGVTLIEASAGTGKTHMVTSLATIAIAEGTPLDQVLLVTFTRAATGELRDRIWHRLVSVSRDLDEFLRTGTAPADDASADLCHGDRAEVEVRRDRLRDAVANFDAATISTIHSFCDDVLNRIGFAGDVERETTFLDDPRELTRQVVDDLLIQRFSDKPGGILDGFTRSTAIEIANAVVRNPLAHIVPTDAEPGTWERMRIRFADAVRQRLDQRKRELRVMGYDDLLIRLDESLRGPNRDTVRARLHAHFSLVVVDEFQDTDAVQWSILDNGFSDSETRLILVGDPKQAIYSFRGADVHAYLAARDRSGTSPQELRTNYRSDAGLLTALDTLFGSRDLGHPDIRYQTVEAADRGQPATPVLASQGRGSRDPARPERELAAPAGRLETTRKPTPLRLRRVLRSKAPKTIGRAQAVVVDWARQFIAEDLAADIVFRLNTEATIPDAAIGPDAAARRELRPDDIAVLVQRHADAATVRDALWRSGVPAVLNGTGSVFATPSARDWIILLEAIESPAQSTRVRSALLTPFLGWEVDDIDRAGDARWDEVHDQLHEWRRMLRNRGPAGLFDRIAIDTDFHARVLGTMDGERTLTDLAHIARLLTARSAQADASAAVLLSWLRERVANAEEERDVEAQQRRLETDARAVQVWTVHRSKGLEFPIVYVPYLWQPGWIPDDAIPEFHDPEADDGRGGRCVDVGGPRDGYPAHVDAHVSERRGEEMRLAYVAMTRAKHQVVAWWAPSRDTVDSALTKLIFSPERTEGTLDGTPSDDRAGTIFGILEQASAGTIAVEEAVGADETEYAPATRQTGELAVRQFTRTIDRDWRRTSYSGMTAWAHERATADELAVAESASTGGDTTGAAVEHDDRGIEDERIIDPLLTAARGTGATGSSENTLDAHLLRSTPSVFDPMVGGARFGTMVHAVLEEVDFAATDIGAELRAAIAAVTSSTSMDTVEDVDVERLAAGLEAAIETPLGPLAADTRLRDLARPDRLDELHFELPLGGGDEPTGTVTMAAIADVVARTLPADDVLAGYHEHLASEALAQSVHGYLSGSIDLVARLGGRSDGRFIVADYKSNWLGVDGEELSAWHYRPEAVRDAMVRAHYPLQAMLYTVALHRFLRSRVSGYAAERHLGGVLYLFLRGMTGPDTPRVDGQPCGVFAWHPPVQLVIELSDLLHDGVATAAVPR